MNYTLFCCSIDQYKNLEPSTVLFRIMVTALTAVAVAVLISQAPYLELLIISYFQSDKIFQWLIHYFSFHAGSPCSDSIYEKFNYFSSSCF